MTDRDPQGVGDSGPQPFGRLTAFYMRHRETVLDLLTGAALLVALSLIMNRGLFGFETMDGWVVNYGNF